MWVRSRSRREPPLRGGCALSSCRGAAAGGGPRDVSAGGSALEILAGGAGTHPSRENFGLLGKPPQRSSRRPGGDARAACGQTELSGCCGHRSSSVCPPGVPRWSTEPLHACLCHRNTAPAPALLPLSLLTLPWCRPGPTGCCGPEGTPRRVPEGTRTPGDALPARAAPPGGVLCVCRVLALRRGWHAFWAHAGLQEPAWQKGTPGTPGSSRTPQSVSWVGRETPQ